MSATEFDEQMFELWIDILTVDVVQGEYGYEPGEFTIYPDHWRALYDEGLTPVAAWRRALDAHANGRIEDECLASINWARIQFEEAQYRRDAAATELDELLRS